MQKTQVNRTDNLYEHIQPHLTSLFEYNTDAICCLDLDGHIIEVNPAFINLSGYSRDELINRHHLEFIAQDFENNSNQPPFEYLDYFDARFQFIKNGGTQVPCLMHLTPIKHKQNIIGYFLTIKNMIQLDKIAERFLESELNYRIIAENFQDVLILMDKDRKILYISPSVKDIFGFDYMAIINDSRNFNIHPDYLKEFYTKFDRVFVDYQQFEMKLMASHKERGYIWTEIKGKPVYNKQGEFLHMLVVARDISKEREQEESLMFFAYHDMLTGVPNRRLFQDYLTSSINLLKAEGLPFAVMILDIDDFKHINDSYGHELGDKVIIEFSDRLRRAVDSLGIVARMGGDEFTILITEYKSIENIEAIADCIIELVGEPFIIQQTHLEITTSIGIKICNDPTIDATAFLKFADDALYRVKGQGKNEYSIY